MTAGHDGPSLDCDLPLGRPGLTVHNELVLTGWATSPRGISGVAVQIGERQWNAAYGLDTPAIARRSPDVPKGDRAGYELRIDTSRWPAGQHYVTVAAFDVEGGRSAMEGGIEVLPFEPAQPVVRDGRAAFAAGGIAMSLDEPVWKEHGPDDTLEISGWAYAEKGIEAVTVAVDGHHQHEALRPVIRPDLTRDYGPEVAAQAGFVSRLDGVQCPPGKHSIVVVAIGRDGRAVGLEREIGPRSEPHDSATPGVAVSASEVALHWQQRALLAEADAAVSRTESGLARAEQERAARRLRQIEVELAETREQVNLLEESVGDDAETR